MKRTGFKRKPKKAKPKKTPKIKLPPKPALMKLAFRLMSLYVRHRDNFICFTCGNPGNDAGHYQHAGRSNWVSYDSRNINCQCTSCNSFKNGNLVVYSRKLVQKYGSNVLEEIEESYRRSPMKAPDLISMIKVLDIELIKYGLDPYDAIGKQFQGTYKRVMEVNDGKV